MRDFEMEFILKRNELILKYGESVIKVPSYKSAGLMNLQGGFVTMPNNLSIDEEISKLEEEVSKIEEQPSDHPKKYYQINKLKEHFLFNRFSEIVLENKNSTGINKENYTTKDKIDAVKHLGFAISVVLSDGKVDSGHYRSEVIFDLYNLYILQYGLYSQNPNHPIFLNAIIEEKIDSDIKVTLEDKKTNLKTGGCFNFVLIMLLVITTIIVLI